MGAGDESHSRDSVVVGEDGLVAVAEVEAPYLEVLVGAARGDQRRVRGDVHGRDGKLVAVQREEELEGVGEEYLELE